MFAKLPLVFATTILDEWMTGDSSCSNIEHRLPIGVNFEPFLKHWDQCPKMLVPYILLHLYRLSASQLRDKKVVQSEVKRLAMEMLPPYQEAATTLQPAATPELRTTGFGLVRPGIAAQVHQCCHYLRSPRAVGLHLGLHEEGSTRVAPKLLSVVTVSGFDLSHMVELIILNFTE